MVMEPEEQAWLVYRGLLFTLYDEIGSLTAQIHPKLAAKADLKNSFFQREHEKQAAQLYLQTENLRDLEAIERPYRERTGLSVKEVHRAFSEGNWKNRHGGFSSGGPRWAEVARVALELRNAIQRKDWDAGLALVSDVKRMKHNQGLVIERFERINRYRGR